MKKRRSVRGNIAHPLHSDGTGITSIETAAGRTVRKARCALGT
jgi:hypothetical protein